jgi:hypothetical protein
MKNKTILFIDLSRCEQSMLIVFSLKQVFKISSLRSVRSYPRDEITEQQILGFHPMAENSKINNYLKQGLKHSEMSFTLFGQGKGPLILTRY